MVKILKRPLVDMPTLEQDRLINAAARADPDAAPLTPRQLREMVPLRSLRRHSSKHDTSGAARGGGADVAGLAVKSKP